MSYTITELARKFGFANDDVHAFLKNAGVVPTNTLVAGKRTFYSFGEDAREVLARERDAMNERKKARALAAATKRALDKLPNPVAKPERQAVAVLSNDDAALITGALASSQGLSARLDDVHSNVLELTAQLHRMQGAIDAIAEGLNQLLTAPAFPDAAALEAIASAGVDDAPGH